MEMDKKKFQEMREHGDEATRILKTSVQIHEAEKQGLIPEPDAAEIAIELNKQAIAEMDKTIELQRQFIAEQESEKDKSY
jgi:hypothetical protein